MPAIWENKRINWQNNCGSTKQQIMWIFSHFVWKVTVKTITLSAKHSSRQGVLLSVKKYWYFCYFSMKTYVVGTHWKWLSEALLMSTDKMCFHVEIRKILDIFYDFLTNFLPSRSLLTGSTLKGKKGSKFFPFKVDPFSEGSKNQFWKSCHTWKCIKYPSASLLMHDAWCISTVPL